MKIIVASNNPVKLAATQGAFAKVFPKFKFEVVGESLPSGVSDQPMSEEETMKGSINRAINAKEKFPNSDYWVGIEGGISVLENEMLAFAWITVVSKDNIGKGRSASFFLPNKIKELTSGGNELGEAADIVFKENNIKQKNGIVGVLTNNLITRKTYYEPAVILALIPFIKEGLYRN